MQAYLQNHLGKVTGGFTAVILIAILILNSTPPSLQGTDSDSQAAALAEANTRIALLEAELAETKNKLEERGETVLDLTDELENLKLSTATNQPAIKAPKDFQVKAFLGETYLGLGKVYSENARRDAQTGLVAFDPVLRFPKSMKHFFTEIRTNIVEREIETTKTVVQAVPAYVYPNYFVTGVPWSYRSGPSQVNNNNNNTTMFARGPTTRPRTIASGTKPLIGRGTAAPWAKPF